ncbi:MAG: hypothetical protein LBB72_07150, partial [Spirochaetaceae bacterium]|nr:hypothetical protein [Spirochaetaceae bacterium]
MKKQVFSRLYSALFIVCFVLTACDSFNNTVNNKPEELESRDLEKYKKIGEIVAAKEYSLENYDCANFATQFYQDCYKAGLPVRIRIGVSGGERFS